MSELRTSRELENMSNNLQSANSSIPRVSAMVQFASIHAADNCGRSLLAHWQVVLSKVHPTAGMVCAKQSNSNSLAESAKIETTHRA